MTVATGAKRSLRLRTIRYSPMIAHLALALRLSCALVANVVACRCRHLDGRSDTLMLMATLAENATHFAAGGSSAIAMFRLRIGLRAVDSGFAVAAHQQQAGLRHAFAENHHQQREHQQIVVGCGRCRQEAGGAAGHLHERGPCAGHRF